jgi:hypothetical protein
MKRYFRFLQRQPHYVQKFHAGFFALLITLAIAFTYLYYNYGFWNDKYNFTDQTQTQQENSDQITESPFDVLKNIYKEAMSRAGMINFSPKDLLTSTTTYDFNTK